MQERTHFGVLLPASFSQSVLNRGGPSGARLRDAFISESEPCHRSGASAGALLRYAHAANAAHRAIDKAKLPALSNAIPVLNSAELSVWAGSFRLKGL